MSLTVYLGSIPTDLELVHDVQKQFMCTRVKGTTLDKSLIHNIEQGEYLSSQYFQDRFGAKLPIMSLSEGCKAALCVANYPDKVIDLIECGNNAIRHIFESVSTGNVLIREPHLLSGLGTIDIMIDSVRFTSGAEYNDYIENRYPLKP